MSLAIGLVVGLIVGLVPGAILLWLAVQPVEKKWPRYPMAVAFGILLGGGLTAVVTAAVVAVLG